MNANERRDYILSKLPLIDSGGPVMCRFPRDTVKITKSATKAKRLHRLYYYDDYIDVRKDLLHMVKLGMVERTRSGLSRSKRTYFSRVENRRLEPHCYVCTKPLVDEFIIWALAETPDRVFVACLKCEPRLDRPFVKKVYSA